MKQHQKIVAAALVALVVVVGVWYVAFWRPETSHLATARADQAAEVSQLASEQQQLVQLQGEQPKVAQEKQTLAELVGMLPDGPSLDQLLRTIVRAARVSGVVVPSVGTPQPAGWGAPPSAAPTSAPTASATAPGPQSITVSLTVSGSNASILRFVTALDSQPRIYVVDSFSLAAPQSTGAVAALPQTSVTVQAFYESSASGNPTFPGASSVGSG